MRPLFLSIIAYSAAAFISFTSARAYPPEIREDLKLVPSKEIAEILCFDQRGFLADYLFAQVNIHSGSLQWKPLEIQFDSPWSFGIMDLVTDLDPHYVKAYIYSASGLIHDPEDAKRAFPILEKGMKALPDSWELPFWVGFDYFNYFQDYKTSTRYFYEAAQKPEAPKQFLAMLINVARKGGAYETAFWAMKMMYEGAESDKLKQVYESKLLQLENLIVLSRAAEKYREEKGSNVQHLQELVKDGYLDQMPKDPWGVPYVWDNENQRVVLGNAKK